MTNELATSTCASSLDFVELHFSYKILWTPANPPSKPSPPSNGGHLNYINLYHKVTFSVQSKSCQEKGNEEE